MPRGPARVMVPAMALGVGDRLPEVVLDDQDGRRVNLADLYAQGPIVLYFYPKDETPGCTAEACAFRDDHDSFAQAGAKVVGVSSDDVDSHRRFASRHGLPFTLLADPGGRVRAAFGIKKSFGFIQGRVTYVVDQTGVIRHVYDSQLMATRHVREALETVERLARAARPAV
jgi:peroxiredoxin Q/BCP